MKEVQGEPGWEKKQSVALNTKRMHKLREDWYTLSLEDGG